MRRTKVILRKCAHFWRRASTSSPQISTDSLPFTRPPKEVSERFNVVGARDVSGGDRMTRDRNAGNSCQMFDSTLLAGHHKVVAALLAEPGE